MEFDKKIKIEPSSPRGTGNTPDSYYSVFSGILNQYLAVLQAVLLKH